MFERLGEIVENDERYGEHEGEDEPLIFQWFPMKSDYEFIPPAQLHEELDHKIDRVTKLAKSARSDLNQICSGDMELEIMVINFFELRENLVEYQAILAECQVDKAAKDNDTVKESISKAKHILDDVFGQTKKTTMETFTHQIRLESQFQTGLAQNLIPWIDDLQKESFKQLDKPENFEHARKIEQNCVVFAKEVRRANKLMNTLETSIDQLPSKKMYATQQIQEQKRIFKAVATVAATRVETMREMLINWNFFVESKGEAERLTETVKGMFNLEPLPDQFLLDNNDFVHGLPKVLLGWTHLIEQVLSNPPKSEDFIRQTELLNLFTKLISVVELASKLLERLEEVTEKTAAQPEVWDQRCKMKKISSRVRDIVVKMEKLNECWQNLDISEKKDNIDFQPLVYFFNVYKQCYA